MTIKNIEKYKEDGMKKREIFLFIVWMFFFSGLSLEGKGETNAYNGVSDSEDYQSLTLSPSLAQGILPKEDIHTLEYIILPPFPFPPDPLIDELRKQQLKLEEETGRRIVDKMVRESFRAQKERSKKNPSKGR